MDMRDVIAGLASGASTLGTNINRRKEAKEAEERALRLLAAKPAPKDDVQIVTGQDADGPGIFLVDKQKGTKKRVTDEAMAALTGGPVAAPSSLLRKPGDPMPVEAPPIPPAQRMPTSTVPVPEDAPHDLPATLPAVAPPMPPPRKLGLQPIPKPEPKPTQPHRVARDQNVDGKPMTVMVDPAGRFYDAEGKEIAASRVTPIVRETSQPLVTDREGVRVPDVPGVKVPLATPTGAAKIRSDVAANRAQIAIIDDAVAELDKHPDAVGLKRGFGELVPGLGALQDAVNQRADTAGVAARASLANIGSMVIKDRSGAAVTVSEYPRLKPFIPTSSDTPQAIRVKLKKLRDAIELETRLLEEGGGTPTPDQKALTKGADPLVAKYGLTPPGGK